VSVNKCVRLLVEGERGYCTVEVEVCTAQSTVSAVSRSINNSLLNFERVPTVVNVVHVCTLA
jgi:hypothetical protein